MTMALRWQKVDEWRAERKLSNAEFARQSGIPENTYYRGMKANSVLQPTTKAAIRAMFPEKFDRLGNVLNDGCDNAAA